jgi:uncharacterized DUF497 family protein
MDAVSELLVPLEVLNKLGVRNISEHDAEQVLRNGFVLVRDPAARPYSSRRLLVGRDNGGRALTFVVEATIEPTTWVVVTGWEAAASERKILETR